MPIAGGEQEQLTTDPADDFQPHWSHDGREPGFHTFRSGTRDLYVMSATGADQRPVVASAANDRDPGWSPMRPPDVLRVRHHRTRRSLHRRARGLGLGQAETAHPERRDLPAVVTR